MAQLVPSGVSTVCTEETMTGNTHGQECSHDDVGLRPRMNIESPYGGGQSYLPGTTGSLLPEKFPVAPVLRANGPQLGSWRVAVVRVDETPVGDTSGRERPRSEQIRQQPSDVFELHGGPGFPCVWEMLPSPEVAGSVLPVVLAGGYPLAGAANPAGPDGPVVAGGPVGTCETTYPSSCGALEPLEHSLMIHADPAGQHATVGTLSPSDCYPAGPAGPYVAGARSAQMFRLRLWNR